MKVDRLRATRRFGVFAVLTLRVIKKIRAGKLTATEAAAHFEQVARAHGLRETGHYDPPAVGGHADFEGAGGQERRAPHGRRLTGTAVSQGGALRLFRASPLPGSPQPKPSAVTIRGYLLPSMAGRNLRPPRRTITP